MNSLLWQFAALCTFLLLMGFTFCDGFKLHTGRKLLWFAFFAAIAIHNLKINGEFVLEQILPGPCFLAFALGWYEIYIVRGKKK